MTQGFAGPRPSLKDLSFRLLHLLVENLGTYLRFMAFRAGTRHVENGRTFLMCTAARSTPKSLLLL